MREKSTVDSALSTTYLALEVVGAALAVYLTFRILIGPDTIKTARMGAIRSFARLSKVNGERLTALGNRLDSEYWKIAA